MKTLFRISLGINLLTIFSFCFPFFLNSCEGKTNNSAENCIVNTDSIVVESSSVIDSIRNIPENEETSNDSSKVLKLPSSTKKDENFATQIVENYPILKPIIKLEHNTYTGLGMIFISLPYYFIYVISLGLIMLILGFFSKLVEHKIIYTHFLIEVFSLLFLCFSSPVFFDFEYLWGYWLCLGLIIFMLIYDSWLIYKMKKSLTIAR